MGFACVAHLLGFRILLSGLLIRGIARHATDGKGAKRFRQSRHTRGGQRTW